MKRLSFLAILTGYAIAAEESGKLSPDLQQMLLERRLQRADAGELDVIVQYHAAPTAKAGRAGRVKRAFDALPAEVMAVRADRLGELAADPNVAYVTPDREVRATGSTMIALDNLRVLSGLPAEYETGVTGSGIGVAVLDSGVVAGDPFFNRANTCTSSRIAYSQNFVSGSTTTDDPYGHGTHVAGIIAGNGRCLAPAALPGATGFSGIAPAARLVNLRVLDGSGRGTDSAVITAIDRAIALKSTYNIRVMNLSLGRFIQETYALDPLCQAVERAWKAGIVVVVAAGNNGRDNSMNTQGYSTITSPGNDPYVLTVGAARFTTTLAGGRNSATVASYSSKGPTLRDLFAKPDLVAPGNLVFSRVKPDARLTLSYSTNAFQIYMNGVQIDSLFVLSGTSMAAPVVSGTAALLIAKDTSLTPDQVKARLMKTAWKGFPSTARIIDTVTGAAYDVQHDLLTVGTGMLDIPAALANTEKIPADARAISPKLAIVNGKVRLARNSVSGVSIVWGENTTWGQSIVWGENTLLSNSVVWGENVVWGSSNMAGYSVVWGENVVWGSGNPFSEALAVAGDR